MSEIVSEPAADQALDPSVASPLAVSPPAAVNAFAALGLSPALLRAVADAGFEVPTAVQARAIPVLLQGKDVLGRAQTGTGKTAAFALPILQGLTVADRSVQALILAPTRELAVQVADAIRQLAVHHPGVGVVAIYGGAPFGPQMGRLKDGCQVVVGTPGRVLDHLSRGTLKLDKVRFAILDEGDEMLRMGFAEDVETILGKMPTERQTALFSATLPAEIARIASQYLREPVRIEVSAPTRTVLTIEQRYLVAPIERKVEALARVLACEPFAAALVFARTRAGCAELTDMLQNGGLPAEAMHGDLAQAAREAVLRRLRSGQLKVLVATDVAARGLDVDLIDLVVNMEVPDAPETYVHRIGRTGRAGRSGKSILFVTPRQERRLHEIEAFTGQRMVHAEVPSLRAVQMARIARFVESVAGRIDGRNLAAFAPIVASLQARLGDDVLPALVSLAWGDRSLPEVMAEEPPPQPRVEAPERQERPVRARREPGSTGPASARPEVERPAPARPKPTPVVHSPGFEGPTRRASKEAPTPRGFEAPGQRQTITEPTIWLSVGVGRRNGVRPQDLVAAVATEASISGGAVGAIEINDNFTLIEIAQSAAAQVVARCQRTMVCGRFIQPRPIERDANNFPPRPPRPEREPGERPPKRPR